MYITLNNQFQKKFIHPNKIVTHGLNQKYHNNYNRNKNNINNA